MSQFDSKRLYAQTPPGSALGTTGGGTATDDLEDTAEIRLSHLKGSLIMMVDDESITTEVIQSFLQEDGYRNFLTTDQSTEALDLIERERPDILLLDLMMPEVSGFDILRAVRANRKTRHLPVIMLTSSADSETKLEALELGATDFLAKPVDPSELSLRLRNALAAKGFQDQFAYRDDITGLMNRRTFVDRVSWSLLNSADKDEVVAVVQIGINELRAVNEEFGMKIGDSLLRRIGKRIETSVAEVCSRDAVAAAKDYSVSRFWGGEFSVLLVSIRDVDVPARVAEKIAEEIAKPIKLSSKALLVTARTGTATSPDDAGRADELIGRAMSAMHDFPREGDSTFPRLSK